MAGVNRRIVAAMSASGGKWRKRQRNRGGGGGAWRRNGWRWLKPSSWQPGEMAGNNQRTLAKAKMAA
jgi:hypothetical protein